MSNYKKDTVTGNYYPVKKDGEQIIDNKKGGKKWRIELELPQIGKNKRPRKVRTFYGSERRVKKEMQSLITYYDSKIKQRFIPRNLDLNDGTKTTFEEYAKDWLKINLNNEELNRRTIESYASIANKYVFPSIGHLMLADITPLHISRYKEITLGSLSASTVNKHLSFISNVLDDASSDEKRIIQYNPAILVKRVKNKKGKDQSSAIINCLNVSELNDMLSRLQILYSLYKLQISQLYLRSGRTEFKKDPEVIKKLKYVGYTDKEIASTKALYKLKAMMLYPIVYLGSVTGMRLSELLALRWRDIDLENKIILVYSSSHYGIGEDAHHINTTKEGKPKSHIDITDQDVKFLKRYKKEQLEHKMRYRKSYIDNDLVFAKKNGTYLRNDTVSKEFTGFVNSIGYDVTFHALRHTHCTLLIAAGVPVMYVARRLGHQNPNTTNAMYSHVEKANDLKLSEIFQTILDKSRKLSPKGIEDAKKKASKIFLRENR